MENPFKYSIGTRVREKPFLNIINHSGALLDVGCGLGYFTNMLAKRGIQCDGIDIDKKCIDYCTKHMEGRYKVGDVTNMPFPNSGFDSVLCSEVLEHIPNDKELLAEIYRVLKPEGIAVISVPCSEGIFKSLFKRIGHNNVKSNSYEYHWHKGYNYEQLCKLLKEAGF